MTDPAVVGFLVLGMVAPLTFVAIVAMLKGYDIHLTMTRRKAKPRDPHRRL